MPYKKKFYKKSQIKKSIIKKCNKKNYWSIQGTLFVYNTVVYNLCFNLIKMLKMSLEYSVIAPEGTNQKIFWLTFQNSVQKSEINNFLIKIQ